MIKVTKRLILAFLSICMIFTMTPIVFAAEASYEYSYEFDKASYQKNDVITVKLIVDQKNAAGGFDLYSFTVDIGFDPQYLSFEGGTPSNSSFHIDSAASNYNVNYDKLRVTWHGLSEHISCEDHTELATLKFKALAETPETPLISLTKLISVEAGYSKNADQAENGKIIIGDPAKPAYSVKFERGNNEATGNDPVYTNKTESNTFSLPDNPYKWSNHTFTGWLCNTDGKVYQNGDMFTMPAGNVVFTAQWKQDKYKISFVGGDGTTGSAPDETWLEPNGTIAMYTRGTLQKSGYTFKGWSYNGKTYAVGETFTMPAADVTFTAVWEQNAASGGGGTAGGSSGSGSGDKNDQTAAPAAGACPKDASCPIEPFIDTSNTAWWHDGIHYCLENGLMNGVSKNTFAPNGTTTRGMIVTILWRMEKSPATGASMSFKDVPGGKWYTEAVRWAQSTGVVTGYSDEKFGPEDKITREQLAAILYRYASYKGIDVTARNDLSKFADAGSISSWAAENVKWANASGLINGRSSAQIAPKANATRAEAASMIQRFCENIINWKK